MKLAQKGVGGGASISLWSLPAWIVSAMLKTSPIILGRRRRWFLKVQTLRFQPSAAALTNQVGYLSHATVLCGWLRCEALLDPI